MEFVDGRVIYVINSYLHFLPIEYHYFLGALWTAACANSIAIIPIIFYYRYALVVKLDFYLKNKLFIMFLIYFLDGKKLIFKKYLLQPF